MSRCKLLYRMDKGHALPYGTGNCIPYPVINIVENMKKNVYMHVTETVLYSRDWYNTVNQLYINKKLKGDKVLSQGWSS